MEVLVVSQNDIFAWNVLRCLGHAGIRPYMMGARPWPEYRFSRYCKRYVRCGWRLLQDAAPETIAFINRICGEQSVDVVMPGDLPCSVLLSRIRKDISPALVFPVSPVDLILYLHNKWLFGQFLLAHGLPYPKSVLLGGKFLIDDVQMSFPALLKPVCGEDSTGITRVESPNDLRDWLRAEDLLNKLPAILQEFIPGEDVGMSVLSNHGELAVWTIQRRPPERGAMEFLVDDAVLDLGKRIMQTSGYHGVGHIDMRRDERDNSIKVLEFNPRFWGSLPYSLWAGVNFALLGILLAQGEDPSAGFQPPECLCVHSGIAPRKLLKALLTGRLMPRGLSKASQESWKQNHLDPLPVLYENVRNRWLGR